MLASVVVCTYSLDNLQNLIDAVDSLLSGTYDELEIIIVVDANPELYGRIMKIYDAQDKINITVTQESSGAFGCANVGVKSAHGDVIAFLDDDAVAEKRWVENLIDTYRRLDCLAVGGKILPIWLSKQPDYLPEELGWLVGITHKGFAEERIVEVRNTFGPNMSFKREVFEKVGLFNEKLGFAKRGKSYMQGAEPEFALRMKSKLGRGVIYNPEAVVYHRIPRSKTSLRALLRRAFYQGYSKAQLKRLSPCPEALDTERWYLKDLLFECIPQRIKRAFSVSNSVTQVKQLSVLIASVFSVGLGFAYEYLKRT